LTNITEEVYKDNFEFVHDCFDEDGYLKEGLSEKTKHELRLIFKDVAYRQFLVNQEAGVEQPEAGDDL
jgi:hypothetical protein